MSLKDALTNGLITPPAQPQQTVPKAKAKKHEATEKLPQKKGKHAPPGGAASGKRKPLPRGEPFTMPNTLTKWSTR